MLSPWFGGCQLTTVNRVQVLCMTCLMEIIAISVLLVRGFLLLFRYLSTVSAIFGTLNKRSHMSLPKFDELGPCSASELKMHIADRVRFERRRLLMSQEAFAMQCEIPLRTYKRFEQGQCDSLEAFLRLVIKFERTIAIELLFPPRALKPQETILERMKRRADLES